MPAAFDTPRLGPYISAGLCASVRTATVLNNFLGSAERTGKSVRRSFRALAAAAACAALVVAPVTAASAVTIYPGGPIVQIATSETLNCSVNLAGQSTGEFFDDTACGTFVAVGGDVYGPDAIPAGVVARQTWTPVSQRTSGSGNAADPYAIVTEVAGGGLAVQQTDTYVNGDNHYLSEMFVSNPGADPLQVTLYRAADCYLGENDYGFGAYDAATGTVSCVGPDQDGQASAASRLEQFIPSTAGSDYLYGLYFDIWDAVASGQPLPNELRDANRLSDNGMALSWTVTIPSGGQALFAMQTNFSRLDAIDLSSALTITPTSVLTEDTAQVAARVSNPNAWAQELSGATVSLPAGVQYVSGSAVGIAEPVVNAGQLTFDGARAAIAADGSFGFTFEVTSASVGVHAIGLDAAVASRIDVTPSSAQFTVALRSLSTLLSFDPAAVHVGDRSALTGGIVNDGGVDVVVDSLAVTLPGGASYVPGSAQGLGEPVAHGTTLVFAGPIVVPARSTLPVALEVEATASGAQVFTLTGTSTRATVLDSSAALTVQAHASPGTKRGELASSGADLASLYALGGAGAVLICGSTVLLGFAARRRRA